MIHRFTTGSLPEEEKDKLRGLLAFASQMEPDYVRRMEVKYGKSILKKVQKS
jgi:RNA-directed DNA polymerase